MGPTVAVVLVALGAVLGGSVVGAALMGVIRRRDHTIRVLLTRPVSGRSLAGELLEPSIDRRADTVQFTQPAWTDARRPPDSH